MICSGLLSAANRKSSVLRYKVEKACHVLMKEYLGEGVSAYKKQ